MRKGKKSHQQNKTGVQYCLTKDEEISFKFICYDFPSIEIKSFEGRGIIYKIDGKCVPVTYGLSQAVSKG